MNQFILVGDIGGTKTTLAVFEKDKGPNEFIKKKTYKSKNHNSLNSILRIFLKNVDFSISHASFGVAGPVIEGQTILPNLQWDIMEEELSTKLQIPVKLLNDLEATATAIPHLNRKDLYTIGSGVEKRNETLAVIAPGTGLGEAFLSWNGENYQTHPSEGGHSDFAPIDQIQIDLLTYLHHQFGHVSYERVCSGPGLYNIYSFLKDTRKYIEPNWLKEKISMRTDPSPIISQVALEGTADIAIATMDLFVSVLGSEAGNLALKVLAKGGVFIGGGIPPRIIPYLEKDIFINSFKKKGRLSEVISKIPLYIVQNPDTALIGAGIYGLRQSQNYK